MVNEKITNIKKSAKELEYELRARHSYLKTAGEEVSVLNEIKKYIVKVQAIRLETGIEDVDAFEKKFNRIKREVSKKFNVEIVEALPETIDDVRKAETEEPKKEEKSVKVEKVEKPSDEIIKKKNKPGFLAGVLSALAVVILAGAAQSCATRNSRQNTDEVIVERSESELSATENTPGTSNNTVEVENNTQVNNESNVSTATAEESESEEVTKAVELVLGEYGTFLDASDNEQVEARAQYIYDNYYGQFIGSLSEEEQSLVSPAIIANVIRVMSGELPLDENGNKTMDANVIDNYGQKFVWLTGDIASSPELDSVYHIPAYLFTTDNTKLSEFIKSYDDTYEMIAEGRNTRNGVMTREAIATLGTKFWNEWQCQGMYGDVNPYNFDAKDRLMAYLSSFARYAQYPYEYNLNATQPVCIDACIDYNSKEIQQITVNEIYIGITKGEWDKVIAKTAGIEISSTPDSIYFTQDLLDELTWKYNNLQTLKLN